MLNDAKYKFTVSWFLNTVRPWELLIAPLKNRDSPINALEVGSFEGMSAVWMLENVLTHPQSHITCIDPFTGSEEHTDAEKAELFDRFSANVTNNFPDKVTVIKDYSTQALANLALKDPKPRYDIIYIDGDHHAAQVYNDLILAWPLLMNGGILAMDDYLWDAPTKDVMDSPKPGIEAFLNLYHRQFELLHAGYQIIIKKL